MTLDVYYRHYAVAGTRADDLERCMSMLGPRGPNGPCAAFTQWIVKWAFVIDERPDGYSLENVRTRVKATITLPRWEPPRMIPKELVARWCQFMDYLRDHERGHVRLAADAGSAVQTALASHPSCRDGVALGREANVLAERIIAEYRERELAYDETERHHPARQLSAAVHHPSTALALNAQPSEGGATRTSDGRYEPSGGQGVGSTTCTSKNQGPD